MKHIIFLICCLAFFCTWVATIEFHVRLLEHVENSDLIATGHVVSLGKTISVAEMQVCKPDGQPIALGTPRLYN